MSICILLSSGFFYFSYCTDFQSVVFVLSILRRQVFSTFFSITFPILSSISIFLQFYFEFRFWVSFRMRQRFQFYPTSIDFLGKSKGEIQISATMSPLALYGMCHSAALRTGFTTCLFGLAKGCSGFFRQSSKTNQKMKLFFFERRATKTAEFQAVALFSIHRYKSLVHFPFFEPLW